MTQEVLSETVAKFQILLQFPFILECSMQFSGKICHFANLFVYFLRKVNVSNLS